MDDLIGSKELVPLVGGVDQEVLTAVLGAVRDGVPPNPLTHTHQVTPQGHIQ